MSRAQESSQLIILSVRENGRCVPCIIYPKLVNWNSGATSIESSPPDNHDSDTSDASDDDSDVSLPSTDAPDFEPSGVSNQPFRPQDDFLNADLTDFPQSDDATDEDDNRDD